MPLELTVEQRDLRDALADAWDDTAPGTDVWESLRAMGLTGIPFPEDVGGAESGLKDVAVVMSELGRTMATAPYLSSVVLAGHALLLAGSDAARDVLGDIASGDRVAALVSGPGITTSDVRAVVRNDDTLVLDGAQHAVVDGARADVLVVVAATESGTVLGVLTADTAGLRRTELETLDLTRELARVEFDGVVARRVSGPSVETELARVRSIAMIAVAAEQVGAARACLDMSADYCKHRTQFDRIIGSFQSIKHRLVDMLVAIELAEAAMLDASTADVRDDGELAVAAATARVLASRAAMFAAEESIQVHGGIGFTWEHPLHHYFRRAKTNQLLWGDVEQHIETVAAALVDGSVAG
ncbi:acyl-CoA dehydrogenase family protein [Gordonia sp. 'Campus']|uniref:acyl-CoA dehydrogenase family protein n=1 Tax=Gordonia sp. 'Campus' TaxID=2915824 RepID=UPI001EE4C459|nr:acyl-CoA dehydrogenase family protein [Gordonia sp. 'Campus']